jgi:hypothetical protein
LFVDSWLVATLNSKLILKPLLPTARGGEGGERRERRGEREKRGASCEKRLVLAHDVCSEEK